MLIVWRIWQLILWLNLQSTLSYIGLRWVNSPAVYVILLGENYNSSLFDLSGMRIHVVSFFFF